MAEKKEKIFADGLFIKTEGIPDWMIGKLSIKVAEFSKFVKEHQDGEYLNFNIATGKSGKPYVELDTWKPNQQQQPEPIGEEDSDLPF